MTIRKLGKGEYAGYSLKDGILSVGGEEINLAEKQEDSQVILDIRKDDVFVATVEIPPRRYRQVETVAEDIGEHGLERMIMQEAEELDEEAVTLILWPIAKEELKTNMEEA